MSLSRRFRWWLALACLWATLVPGVAAARAVTWPVTLDYAYLRAALVAQVFPEPGEKATAARDQSGCTLVELWKPTVRPQGGQLIMRSQIHVRAGLTVLGNCISPVEWSGQVEALQEVVLDRRHWRLGVRTLQTRLYGRDGQPAQVANVILSLVQEHVNTYLDQFRVDLSLPKKDLDTQLPLFFPLQLRQRVAAWLASLEMGPAQVGPAAIRIPLTMEVETAEPEVDQKPPVVWPENPLLEAEARQRAADALTSYWEQWDAYLVNSILSLEGLTLTEQERDDLLALLLDTRYSFLEALQDPGDDYGRDLVRQQFMRAWETLAPILQRRLLDRPSPNLFNYLAYFTAGDALAALDQLGPSLGLEISREGLVRLAQLLARGEAPVDLEYRYDLDQELRRLLGMDPGTGQTPGADQEPGTAPPGGQDQGSSLAPWWLFWQPRAAWAQEAEGHPEAGQWLADLQNPTVYLDKVRLVVRDAMEKVLQKKKVAPDWWDFFRVLAGATAWQESCWRQFKDDGQGQPIYLRSYNGTSVGLMQINERVWRGLYDVKKLRWDIAYNAKAGGEILELYLRRYVWPKLDANQRQDQTLVAGVVYALYNGGPGELNRYLQRQQRNKLYLSDRLFLEKYQWYLEGRMEKSHLCLVGSEPTGPDQTEQTAKGE